MKEDRSMIDDPMRLGEKRTEEGESGLTMAWIWCGARGAMGT
jgi:hypothetical protein